MALLPSSYHSSINILAHTRISFAVSCQEKSHPCFLYNNFQSPIVPKWTLSIDELSECFVRIVAVMVNIFRLDPKRKFVDTIFANEEHLCTRGKSSTICRLRRPTSQKRAYHPLGRGRPKAYRTQIGARRSTVLVFLGNKSLIRGLCHEQVILLTPYVQTYRNRANRICRYAQV